MTAPRHPPLSNIVDLLLDAVCLVDKTGNFVYVSAACERIFGYRPEEMIGRPMIDFVAEEDRARTLQTASNVLAGRAQSLFENRYLRKDGQIVHVMWSARWSEAEQLRIAVARDVTQRKHAEAMQTALFAISEAAHAAQDLLALLQRIHKIIAGLLSADHFFVALYDATSDELSFPYYVDEYDSLPAGNKIDSALLSKELIRSGKVLILSPETQEFPSGTMRTDSGRDSLNLLGVPLTTHMGVIGTLVVKSYCAEDRYTTRDIELLQFVSTQIAAVIERKQMEIGLQHNALHDPLTDLPNRSLFHDRLQTALSLAKRNQTRLSLLYIDLDRFKQVNDTLGHQVGDLLLQEVAVRLRQCLRESDTVGRVGGDEFLVLLNNTSLPEHALLVVENIRKALNRIFSLDGHQINISSSIGVAFYPEHSSEFEHLIRCADVAMYAAKAGGGNRFQISLSSGIKADPE